LATKTRKKAAPPDRHARKAMEVGRDLAAAALKARDAALAPRRKAARFVLEAAATGTEAPTANLIFAAGGGAARDVIVAEGDSWFDYPLHDVLRLLEDEHGFDVEAVAHYADRVEAMAYGEGQLADFTALIEKVIRNGRIPRAILLSGGGNDVAGPQFEMLLDHALSARPGLNDEVVSGVVDRRVREAYIAILVAITDVTRKRAGRVVPIVVHGYAHAVPDGRGFWGGAGPLPGPWLRPGFRYKGYSDPDRCKGLVAQLIDRFNDMLKDVARLKGFEHVQYLDLRPLLPNDGTYKTWWANELHPSKKGFEAVAAKFAAAI
jgi:hypothetical protein